jgi:hypothetical protein
MFVFHAQTHNNIAMIRQKNTTWFDAKLPSMTGSQVKLNC